MFLFLFLLKATLVIQLLDFVLKDPTTEYQNLLKASVLLCMCVCVCVCACMRLRACLRVWLDSESI